MTAAADAESWESMGPERARQTFRTLRPLYGEGPELARVEDVQTADGVGLRVYRALPDRPGPGIVYFHGGGWVLGDVDTHDALCRKLARSAQGVVVSVNYDPAPENTFPDLLDQCVAATRFAFASKPQLGIDDTPLTVAGDSAGGNLASAVAARLRDAGDPIVGRQWLLYPAIAPDFSTESYRAFAEGHGLTRGSMEWFWRCYLGDSDGQDLRYADLRQLDLEGLPEATVVTAECDVLRDEGEAYAQALEAAGVETKCIRYDGMLHGFILLGEIFAEGNEVLERLGQSLRS